MQLLTIEHANAILKTPSILEKDPDARVIDDHRWLHLWAVTIRRGHNLFIKEDDLKKLHDIYVDEFGRRGLDHQSPLELSGEAFIEAEGITDFQTLSLMAPLLETVLEGRKPFMLDPEFISFVGSSVSNKQKPGDVDVLWKSALNPVYREKYLETMPTSLQGKQEMVWEPRGPMGPFIPAYELWAIPRKETEIKEPRYTIAPLSPFSPPQPNGKMDGEGIFELLEDDYYVATIPEDAVRLMVHRKENEVIAFGEDLDVHALPDTVVKELIDIKEPYCFIIDGFLSKDILHILDLPWWRDSQHTGMSTRTRYEFMFRLPKSEHVRFVPLSHFENRRETIEQLRHDGGHYLILPGSSAYAVDSESEWIEFNGSKTIKLAAEGSDAQIKDLIDGGKWEDKSAAERFSLMTKRRDLEPGYPFAQLKTIKKGYSAHEVFGIKSVGKLAEEVFRVPNKIATEVKIDGFRTQIHKRGDEAHLFTESGHEITKQIPKVIESVKTLHAREVILDAESTPYGEDLVNLGRQGAAPAFAEGAKEPVDDSLWALHVFDILWLDGKDLHSLPYEERRKILHGLELPVRDMPKSKDDFRNHLWENNVYWATSAEQMVKLADQVSEVPGSEGAMFKQADSEYRLTGATPLWCLTGGTRVFTKQGLIPIAFLRVGDEILTGEGIWEKVEAISIRDAIEGQDVLYDVASNYGIKERMTGLHLVKVLVNGLPEWKAVEDLKIGDELIFPKPKIGEPAPIFLKTHSLQLKTFDNYVKEIPIDADFWDLVGFWVGDGESNASIGEVRWAISEEKTDFVDYERVIRNHLSVEVHHSRDEKRRITHHYIYDKPFSKWLCENFRGKNHRKVIPLWAVHLPQDWFDALMRGYFRADGTKNEKYRERIATSSNHLVGNLLLILVARDEPYNLEYRKPKRGEGAFRFSKIKRSLKQWGESYLFPLREKKKVHDSLKDCKLYDIQVSSGESFTGPYLTMHNSKMKVSYEIDALVVGIIAEGNIHRYVGAVGPMTGVEADVEAPISNPKGSKFVKYKGKIYGILGKSFNTSLKAEIGDIIRVSVKWVDKIDDKVYHWFQPNVVEVREDKTRPDPISVAETIWKTSQAQSRRMKEGDPVCAFLVRGRFDESSPLACCMAPWIAMGELKDEGFTYLRNGEDLCTKIKELGADFLVGTSASREIAEQLHKDGIRFIRTEAETISDYFAPPLLLDDDQDLQDRIAIDIDELRELYDSIRSEFNGMKTSCGSIVPLEKIPLKLADEYLVYPEEAKTWRFVLHFHIRGLSLHGDLRAEISKDQLIGWTEDMGKSLLKPLLRRVKESDLAKVGLTKSMLDEMPLKEVSKKLDSMPEGRSLKKILSQKTQELSTSQLKTLCEEVWQEEVEPVLKNPNLKFYTQTKAPEPHEWLTYQGEVPPGEVGATAELEGTFIIMDVGTIEYGAQKCMAGGTELTIRNENGRIERCPIDEIVIRKRKIRARTPRGFKPVIDWIRIPVNPDSLMSLELDNGARFSCDFKHPSWVWRDEKQIKIPAEQLVEGDLIPVDSEGYEGLALGSYELGRFLGLYLAEGWIPEDSEQLISLTLNEVEVETQEFLSSYAMKFGAIPRIDEHATAKSVSVNLTQAGALIGLIKQFIKPSKSLRRNVFGLSIECRRGIIDGLHEGDKDDLNDERYYKAISQGEKHRELLEDLHHLLVSVGEIAAIHWNPQSNGKYGLRGRVSYDLKNNSKGWWHVYTMPDGSKAIKIKSIDRKPMNLIHSGIKELYDIELEGDEHRICLANGIITSNSYYHEYFLNGTRLKGHFFTRRISTRPAWQVKEPFAWMTFRGKEKEAPYTISKRAVQKGWMPPNGISALPKTIRKQIPDDYRYWEKNNPKETRDALVNAISKKQIAIKLAQRLEFSVKRVWHKGPEVQRGMPIVRYWIILHDGKKVLDAWDFGEDADPLEKTGLTAIRKSGKGLEELIKTTGDLSANHPASQTKKLTNHHDTSDEGTMQIIGDTNNMLRVRFNGKILKGLHIFVKEDPSSDMWIFEKSELPPPKKMLLSEPKMMHLALEGTKVELIEDLLFISGAAIKPGEVIGMDGRPARFTKEGIRKFWPTMYRQPIVVLHGELKGDVIGFVDKIHYDSEQGWGVIDRGIIWHPVGIKLILEKELPDFSIEVHPETIWDPEHKHDIVIDGRCSGLAVVTKGACTTCHIDEAAVGAIAVQPGKVYKFGLPLEQYMMQRYWGPVPCSTQDLADEFGKPRSTVEGWMDQANIPRRNSLESRHLRILQEEQVRKYGGRVTLTALGTGAFTDIPRDDCPQCKEAREGGRSKRNYTAMLFSIGNDHLLIGAPRGIHDMLGLKGVKPKWVLIEHTHEDAIYGLHELRPLNPTVFATEGIWNWLRKHYQTASGQKGEFEDLYKFQRRVIKFDEKFRANSFVIEPIQIEHMKSGDPSAVGYRITIGDKTIWYSSDLLDIPSREKYLKGVDIYIGDGSSMTKGIINERDGQEYGHASIANQVKWALDAGISRIFFTQIGHLGMTHDELNKNLREIGPNIEALHDGQELMLGGSAPGAVHSKMVANELLEGKRTILVRSKPYSEYSKQVVFLLGGNKIMALYVEGYPEGPFDARKIKEEMKQNHGMGEEEWRKTIGNAETVWIYHPRIIKRYVPPREYEPPKIQGGPYIHDVKISLA